MTRLVKMTILHGKRDLEDFEIGNYLGLPEGLQCHHLKEEEGRRGGQRKLQQWKKRQERAEQGKHMTHCWL